MPSQKKNNRHKTFLTNLSNGFDLQQLESRMLMAGDPLTTLVSGGILRVTGTAGEDAISVSRSGTSWTVRNGSWSTVLTAAVTKVWVNAMAGNDSVTLDGGIAVPATLIGDLGNDTLIGTGAADSLSGGVGNDSLVGGDGADILTGDAGMDTLVGGGGANKLYGGLDNDLLTAGSGNDLLQGDAGNDTLSGGDGQNTLYGGIGDDSVTGGIGNDLITGDVGNDTLVGGDGINTLNGGAGNDSLTGGAGVDSMIGDIGNDTLIGGAGNDRLLGGVGDDSLSGGADNDFVQGGLGFDTLSGGDGIDTIDYTDHTAAQAIWLNLAGTTDGGMTGEHDTVNATFEIANGSAGADNISGNDDGDTLYGNAGNDTINAGAGDDKIYGGVGNDALSGHDGNDSIYGGAGDDLLQGQAGDDLLISIGGGKNSLLVGGDDTDTFWLDADVTENVVDASMDETNSGAVHRVAAFANKVVKELNGQALPDPVLKGATVKYRNFKDHSVFASGGPSIDDIVQGQLGDCYFLAQLGSYAKIDPAMIRQSIVDFGDGTYGVQFRKGDAKVVYRIDADLPSYSTSTLAYAAFGGQGSLWAALYEKAWTYQRTTKNTYASIEAGFMTEVAGAFGKAASWGQTSSANTLLADLQAQLAAGKSVTVGTSGEPSGSLMIGGHAYTVISITDDGAGGYTVVVRNPWGIDGYTCGDNVQDGYVTLTSAQFGAWTSSYAVAAA
ncbi:MAG: Alkaline phosphatase [Phycisphaerales bacterium]|nr:Alkaline phosphatase [Phycisphaerales bacterium]